MKTQAKKLIKLSFTVFALAAASSAFSLTIRACHEDTESPASVQSASDAAASVGADIKFEVMPWKACLAALGANADDIVFTASFKEERLQYGLYPTKEDGKTVDTDRYYRNASYSLYTLAGKNNVSWEGAPSPANTHIEGTVTAPRGYSIVDDLKKWGFSVSESNDSRANFNQLINLSGQFVAAAALTEEGDKLLTDPAFAGKIAKVEKPLQEKKYYFMFSHEFYKNHKDVAENYWNYLAKNRK